MKTLLSLVLALCSSLSAQNWQNVPGSNVWFQPDRSFISTDANGDMTVAWIADSVNWNRAPVEVRTPSVFQQEWQLCLTGSAFLADPSNPAVACLGTTVPLYTDWFGAIRQGAVHQGTTHSATNFGTGNLFYPNGSNALPVVTRYSPQLFMWWSEQRPEVRFSNPMVPPSCPTAPTAVTIYAVQLRLLNVF